MKNESNNFQVHQETFAESPLGVYVQCAAQIENRMNGVRHDMPKSPARINSPGKGDFRHISILQEIRR